ncbi:MAG TPA: pyridoxal phosphate-dependent aminotransferase [Chitinophagales bacterium]|nr:pyridoxal phosphate-dependent aminotransferase [Chitinophagales bacterium]
MPSISRKALAMPASPIRKLVPFANAAKQRGVHIYHLNIGQPDIETPEVVWNAMKSMTMKVLEYSPSPGFESYRKHLAEYYQKHYAIALKPTEIIVTNGGSEALMFAMMTCFNEGDEVIVTEPFYANYNGFAAASGVVVKAIRADILNGFALPGIRAFEKLITPKTKGILICNPNNPTGYLYSEAELLELRKLALERDLYLIVDEVYRDFVYDGKHHTSVLNLQGLEQNVLVVDSVSKRFSMCGARVGVVMSRNEEVMQAVMKFAQARLSPPTFGQIAAEAALNVSMDYFTKVNAEYVSRRDLMVELLNNIDGVFCPTPGGAFYAIAQLPIDDSDVFCQWLLESFNLDNETVMLAPATGFYSSPNCGKNEVRLAYVLNKQDLTKAMKCLEVALQRYPGRVENTSTAQATAL